MTFQCVLQLAGGRVLQRERIGAKADDEWPIGRPPRRRGAGNRVANLRLSSRHVVNVQVIAVDAEQPLVVGKEYQGISTGGEALRCLGRLGIEDLNFPGLE